MLVQVSADRRSASVVSIPRDSWVEIPGRGRAEVNAAYSWGGPALLVGTVEKLIGIRVDHFAVMLRLLAFDVRPQLVVFLTAPGRGAGSEGGQSVVLLDDASA
ncbi:MAG TPA: LCP family protein, partial [Pseudonocardia sp.]|nr:LCP family protein [Pseudonocardia sp.]